jgi:hypothetical protein
MKNKKCSQTGAAATSIESSDKSRKLAERLSHRIPELARRAGKKGITINEAERQISDHKSHSVSPRFSELVQNGVLVRILVDHGRPTKRFPHGVPRYLTRYDEETRRNVTIHWLPEMAPEQTGSGTAKKPSRGETVGESCVGKLEGKQI